jgi:hypothetical protein
VSIIASLIRELAKAAQPLFDWMHDNCSPHDLVIVDIYNAKLLEGAASIPSDLTIQEREAQDGQ